MSNRFGQAYGLTAFHPIIDDADDAGVGHDVALRGELRDLNTGLSPFARVPTTHLARWCIIDEATYESIPARVDHFQSKYLLFTSNFDGGLDADDAALARYVRSMQAGIPDILERVYRHCVGFPGVSDPAALLEYFRRCQVNTTFLFGAYPDASVERVLRALVAQRDVATFIADQQDARPSAAALQRAFMQFSATLAKSPTPPPGSYL